MSDIRTAETLIADPWDDYALLDSGEGRKLERFGSRVLDRPDSQALWARNRSADAWAAADARFTGGKDEEGQGRWDILRPHAEGVWPLTYGPVRCEAQLTGFRHVGIFPEQRVHWDFMAERMGEGFGLLNLFGYTGLASLLPAASGAKVTHVDASKKAISWARGNQAASGLTEAPLRWICDDAARFAAREVRRGNRYDGIVLDPPKYGRGPKNEVWRLEEQLPGLLADVRSLLDADSSFMVLTAYATHLSAITLRRLVEDAMDGLGGAITHGEMTIREEGSDRLLPTSLYVRWDRHG